MFNSDRMEKGDKVYFVTGKDFMGNAKSVRVYAKTPADARLKGSLDGVASHSVVKRA